MFIFSVLSSIFGAILLSTFSLFASPAPSSPFCIRALAGVESLGILQAEEFATLESSFRILEAEKHRIYKKIPDEDKDKIREIENIPTSQFFFDDRAVTLYEIRVQFLLGYLKLFLTARFQKLILGQVNIKLLLTRLRVEANYWATLAGIKPLDLGKKQIEKTLSALLLRTDIREISEEDLFQISRLRILQTLRNKILAVRGEVKSRVDTIEYTLRKNDIGGVRLVSQGISYHLNETFSPEESMEIIRIGEKYLVEKREVLRRAEDHLAQLQTHLNGVLSSIPRVRNLLNPDRNQDGQLTQLLLEDGDGLPGCCGHGCASCSYTPPSPRDANFKVIPRSSPFGHSHTGLPFYVVADRLKDILPNDAFDLPSSSRSIDVRNFRKRISQGGK